MGMYHGLWTSMDLAPLVDLSYRIDPSFAPRTEESALQASCFSEPAYHAQVGRPGMLFPPCSHR